MVASIDDLRSAMRTWPVLDKHTRNLFRPHRLRSNNLFTIKTGAAGGALKAVTNVSQVLWRRELLAGGLVSVQALLLAPDINPAASSLMGGATRLTTTEKIVGTTQQPPKSEDASSE
jgi:hypothetical protein